LEPSKEAGLIESDNPTWIDLAENWGKQAPLRRFSASKQAEMQIPRGLEPARNDNPEENRTAENQQSEELEKQPS
jgi:hypothetical protein